MASTLFLFDYSDQDSYNLNNIKKDDYMSVSKQEQLRTLAYFYFVALNRTSSYKIIDILSIVEDHNPKTKYGKVISDTFASEPIKEKVAIYLSELFSTELDRILTREMPFYGQALIMEHLVDTGLLKENKDLKKIYHKKDSRTYTQRDKDLIKNEIRSFFLGLADQ